MKGNSKACYLLAVALQIVKFRSIVGCQIKAKHGDLWLW